jgi:alpha-galactosidase
VIKTPTTRRQFLRLVARASVAARAAPLGASTTSGGATPGQPSAAIGDAAIKIEFDSTLRSQVFKVRHDARGGREVALTHRTPTDYALLAGGTRVDQFVLRHQEHRSIDGPHGPGQELTVSGLASLGIEKSVRIALYERYPGFAVLDVSYRNLSPGTLTLHGWHNAELELLADESGGASLEGPQFWSYCGSTHEDRRDWVQPLHVGFEQQNFMGMSASDYGGGTPVVDVWRRDCGLAVGHLETTPRLISLPVKHGARGVSLAIAGELKRALEPGEQFATPLSFIAVHSGDYFSTLDTYRRIMSDRGARAPKPPEAAYEPIWCAWGYERQCTPQLIEETLPKVKDLGLRWAVIDDGWQSNVGDWNLDPRKYPHGASDVERLVSAIRSESLKPRLWIAPLAAAPGSDVLHDHSDMLLLDKDGAPQLVSWWNSLYLCPAYPKTVEYFQGLVRRFIGEWGFAGLKIDGQHLNAVAPCYNPAHNHARPEESVEKLQDFFQALYLTARQLDPEVVMELCPCGTSYSFFNFASMNQAPASDPESSWQVRHKGKTLKALMGASAAFAGDHVELSDGEDDFASTVGIGAIVSTKFTWPRDPKPKDSFLLTPEKERLWRKWIALYNERVLPKGVYRGELYDIGFDRPETHLVERSGRFYYALYARAHRGPVTLRGLAAGRYRVRDYFNERDLGEVSGTTASLDVSFERFLLLEAIPV